MSGHVYILTDGINTKIGITISLDKRMSSYNTHNPNFYTYKVYGCDIEEAKKVEAVIKTYFKDKLSGSSKEWFTVQPEQVEKIVTVLLEKPIEENITPAMHGVRLGKEALDTKNKTLKALEESKGWNNEQTHAQKNKMAELFANAFKLGIPEHRLPDGLVIKDSLSADLNHCDNSAGITIKAVQNNYVKLPYDDHLSNFYHLVKMSTGNFIAICTSRVSMPYLDRIEGRDDEILEAARDLGFYAFNYHDWSWHAPEKTGLILFMQKTPVQQRLSLWDMSLRKWVIERSKLLEQEKFEDKEEFETYKKAIYDLSNDETFPLDVRSAKELYERYMEPFWDLRWDDEYPHFMMDAYDHLFDLWQESKPQL
jgi:hypothetical protein